MGQKMYSYQLYKLQWKSLKNPISVCKWEIAPFPLQSILGFVFLFTLTQTLVETKSNNQQSEDINILLLEGIIDHM